VFLEERNGDMVNSYDFEVLSEALEEFREELNEVFPSIPVHKITILTVDDVRYDNIVMAIDVCVDHGFDQPGLQVAAYNVLQRAIAAGEGGE
jgi:hypothetical protein